LPNTRFQSLRRLELKRTILQAFRVEHFASQKWSGEWVELIQKYRTHITQYFIDITSFYTSPAYFKTFENKDLATFLLILFSCTLTFSSFDVVELLGGNVNNARTRI